MIPLRWVTESSRRPGRQGVDFDPRHPVARLANSTSPPSGPCSSSLSWASSRSHGEPEDPEDATCVICMERPSDVRLRPCGHDRFCRRCIVETVCQWSCFGPPCCPLCRAPFGTMVFSELAAAEQG
mmetsp:Transcript_77792/g.209656  ORF Transcript_77792/g.209656 Transcript_77792/m.209656 type:complete len:126 (+) Transcript_77792:638-1015(+)